MNIFIKSVLIKAATPFSPLLKNKLDMTQPEQRHCLLPKPQ